MTEVGDVIKEYEEQHGTSVTNTTTTLKFSKQNGANGISIGHHVVNTSLAGVKNVQLNGPKLTETKMPETLIIGSSELEVHKSHLQTLTSTENTNFLNGKYCH
jgi:hypothetical protein